MEFQALYHPDLLRTVNARGDVGIVTLWSPLRTVERKLAADAAEVLDPAASRVAVLANLYGDGMYAMLCNLLFNPQVRHLVALGQNLGLGAADQIAAFLADGLEDATLLGQPVKRIRGTDRVLPAVVGFDELGLRERLTFHALGRLSEADLGQRLRTLLAELPRAAGPPGERVRVEIPTAVDDGDGFRPSRPDAHQVLRRGPLDCWEELVVRAVRFGRPVELATGPRLELLNARAVIAEPADDPPEALAAVGFDLDRFRAYQRRMLDPRLPDGIAYTYGNRLRGHFGAPGQADALAAAIATLRRDRRTRSAYVSLWDTAADLVDAGADGRDDDDDGGDDDGGPADDAEPRAGSGPRGDDRARPCLATVFFRVAEDRLTLTATYRAHNLLTAWLENVYGLMAIQRHVADGAGVEPGAISVISHSLGIDPRSPRYPLARALADGWRGDDDVDRRTGKASLREDPHGYFVVSADVDRGMIVADHRFGGVLLRRYEAERAETIERRVAADMAVGLVSHALWLGRELARAQQLLDRGGPR